MTVERALAILDSSKYNPCKKEIDQYIIGDDGVYLLPKAPPFSSLVTPLGFCVYCVGNDGSVTPLSSGEFISLKVPGKWKKIKKR